MTDRGYTTSEDFAKTHDSPGALLVERAKTHGDYSVHARLTQTLKKAFDAGAAPGNARNDLPATHAEALDMLFHKIGRIGAGDASFKDHWDDIAGYARLVSDRL